MSSITICTPHQILFASSNKGNWNVWGHVWERRDVRAGFWWANSKERDHVEDSGVEQNIILKWILKGIGWTK
jgi:hypothetical protein